MKRLLVLLPLLLVGCTNESSSKNNSFYDGEIKVYTNVTYEFSFENHNYLVYIENTTFVVEPSNFYYVEIAEWHYVAGKEILKNEFYIRTRELFVYHRQ